MKMIECKSFLFIVLIPLICLADDHIETNDRKRDFTDSNLKSAEVKVDSHFRPVIFTGDETKKEENQEIRHRHWKERETIVVDSAEEAPLPVTHHEVELRVVENPPDEVKPLENGDDKAEAVMEDVRHHEEETQSFQKKEADSRPNIILIMTDDQDIELGSMQYMPETVKIFQKNGVEFRHGYVTTPMCCPSRSSLLTGLYVHNHNVYTNNDNCSSVLWREKHEKNTFAAHLWSAGYYSSYIGKYLNKYDGSHIPYGWDEWNGLLMNSRFYNYTVNRNGRRYRHGNDYQNDYYPDLIANDTIDFLTRVGKDEAKRPFLLVASFPSPHGPEDSAPQYSNMFMNVTSHHTPSYNYAPNLDKQWILRTTEPMTPILKDFTNLLMTKRLQTLQSVDVAVKAIFEKLKSTGLDANTYVFYTSDHGYHVGQFGLVKGKSMPYEFDIRVPFFLHGPESVINKGSQIMEPVLNIDLAPTFLDLAGISVPSYMDGRSFVPLIKKYSPQNKGQEIPIVWKDVFLIESSGRREIPSSGAVTPPQSAKKSKKQTEDRRKLLFDDSKATRTNNLCLLHPHPCLPGQKKYCRKDKDRVHFRKCRSFDFFDDSIYSNDPLYQVVSNLSSSDIAQSSFKQCRCRFRRSSDGDFIDPDWEIERKKIDDEIEMLKKRIEELRNKRKEMRRKWLQEQNNEDDNLKSERKGKSHHFNKESDVTEVHSVPESHANDTSNNRKHEVDEQETTFFEGGQETHHHSETDETDDEGDENSDDEFEEPIEDNIETTSHHHNREPPVSTSDVNVHIHNNEESTTIVNDYIENEKNNVHNQTKENHELSPLPDNTDNTDDDQSEKELEPLGLDFESDIVLKPHKKHKGRNRSKDRNRQKFSDGLKGTKSDIDEDYNNSNCDCYNDPRWNRQREREERKRKKLLSKLRKKQKYMKRIEDPKIRKQAETCGTEEKVNCFWHDNDHWKTAPFWESGSFCFCMNSNNNTYSCLRSVNSTHNYLYCQFVTGFKMYFDLRQDPYQLKNLIGTLPASDEDWMLIQLFRLKKCRGREECWAEHVESEEGIQSSIWEQIFGRWPRKKKRGNRKRQF